MARKGPAPTPLIDRLLRRVVVSEETGCWRWTGYVMPNGYAKLTTSGDRSNLAHRLIYEEMIGPIPAGADLDHSCHNADPDCPGGPACVHRRCVNPKHLVPSTRSENLGRSVQVQRAKVAIGLSLRNQGPRRPANAAKTHCPKGHEYTKENTRMYRGSRRCRQCDRDQHNAAYRSRRGGDAQ